MPAFGCILTFFAYIIGHPLSRLFAGSKRAQGSHSVSERDSSFPSGSAWRDAVNGSNGLLKVGNEIYGHFQCFFNLIYTTGTYRGKKARKDSVCACPVFGERILKFLEDGSRFCCKVVTKMGIF